MRLNLPFLCLSDPLCNTLHKDTQLTSRHWLLSWRKASASRSLKCEAKCMQRPFDVAVARSLYGRNWKPLHLPLMDLQCRFCIRHPLQASPLTVTPVTVTFRLQWQFCVHIRAVVMEENGQSVQYWTDCPFSSTTTAKAKISLYWKSRLQWHSAYIDTFLPSQHYHRSL